MTGFNKSDGASATFTQGSFSSVQTDFPEGVGTLFNNQFVAAAGTPINVTSNSGGNLQIKTLSVELVPPPASVPAPLPVMGAAAALGYSRKLRRRMASSRQQA